MTRSPDKGRPARLTLSDLAPAQRIDCIHCDQPRPAAGSIKFHACSVCAECAAKLQAQPNQPARQGVTT